MYDKLYIYNIKNYEFKIEKEINYNINNVDFGCHNMRHIMNNNIAFLSVHQGNGNILNLNILKYPDYKLEKIYITNNFYGRDLIQMDNLIIICFLYYLSHHSSDYSYKILSYDMEERKKDKIIDNIKIPKFNHNIKNVLDCYKISKDKILFSASHKEMIINVKTKQIETFINDFRNISLLENIGNYKMVAIKNIISLIDIRKGKLYYKYKHKLEVVCKGNDNNILSIVDIGNNQFCVLFEDNRIYLFSYN